MPRRVPVSGDSPEVDELTAAVNRLDEFSALGRLQLARRPLVTSELARRREADTPFQRGRILSEIIRREIGRQIDGQRAGKGAHTAEWTILHYRINEGYAIEDIADVLSIPPRSVGRYYRRGKELLLNRLYEEERRLTSATLYCPACGLPLSSDRIDDTVALHCSGCGSSVEVTADSVPHTYALRVRPRP